jgi:hypothetical protein
MQNKEIKIKVINILDLKEKCNLECNLDITCELYKIFNELSIECFDKYKDKQLLCYDQLCIYLDGINDNMCNLTLIKNLTCTIYESGLVSIEYDIYDSGLIYD